MQDLHTRSGRITNSMLVLTLALVACVTPNSIPRVFAQATPKVHRKVLVMFDPEYPSILKNGHFEGQVRLEATVLPNGSVAKVDVKGGNPMLAQCGVQAVMKWKYVPGPDKTVEDVVFSFNASK